MSDNQTYFTLDHLFSAFSTEFLDEETGSYYTQPLGERARHKGQLIDRTLSLLSEILAPLLDNGWSCYWEGSTFNLTCPRPHSIASIELRQVAGAAADWFSNDSGESEPYDWGGRNLWSREARPEPNYEVRSVVMVSVLHPFHNEMELSGVGLFGDMYFGPEPQRWEWPTDEFDLAAHIRQLGETIRARLTRLAEFFDNVERHNPWWIWFPNLAYAIYECPLSPSEATSWVTSLNIPNFSEAASQITSLNIPIDRVDVMTQQAFYERCSELHLN